MIVNNSNSSKSNSYNNKLEDDSKIEVKIADFGFGKILGSDERAIDCCGTLGFMAPEIIKKIPYNNKVDVWSLGVIIYYMVAKNIPFAAETTKETAKLICKKELIFPSQFKKVNEGMISLINSCLKKKPEERISIDMVLKHKWFRMFNLTEIENEKEKEG